MSTRAQARLTGGRREALAAALSAGAVMLGAMTLLAAVERLTSLDVFALPFIASAGVLAMAPKAPLARPAAIVLSYPASVLIAVVVTTAVGPSALTATAATVPSIITMLLLRAPHVPAAVAAALIGMNDAGFGYLITAVLPAMAILVATALLAGRLLPCYGYPATWR